MRSARIEFTSCMSRRETIACLVYLPVHVLLLPLLLGIFMRDAVTLNLVYYLIGVGYMLAVGWRFLRREFDPLCDGLMRCVLQICGCYGLMLLMNLCVNYLLIQIVNVTNPNNASVMQLVDTNQGTASTMAIFLAPLVEEMLFRAGVFGTLRRRSRFLAYVLSILLFSVYHVWSYAALDARNWIYVIQYLPISYLLCRCYERSNTIWASIFLHMGVNAIAIKAMTMLGELM